MLINSEVHKRIQVLSDYINSLSESVDKNNFSNATLLVRENKKKIINSVFLHSPQSQLLDSLARTNFKLKEEIELLKEKKALMKAENDKFKFGFNSGMKEEKVKVAFSRFKVTLADSGKIDFQEATISGDFDVLEIYSHFQEDQKILHFGDFLVVEKKNVHLLLEYERNSQRKYLMIECTGFDQALRLFRSLSFGKLIKENCNRKYLFVPDEPQPEQEEQKPKDLRVSDSMSRPSSKKKQKSKEFTYFLTESQKTSKKNLHPANIKVNEPPPNQNIHTNSYLYLLPNANNGNTSINNHIVHNYSQYLTMQPALNQREIYPVHNSSKNQIMSPSLLGANRNRGGTQQNSFTNSMFGPMHLNNSNSFRKTSEDFHPRKASFQQPIIGKQDSKIKSGSSFDQSGSNLSFPSPPPQAHHPRPEPIDLKKIVGKGILDRQRQRDKILGSMTPQTSNINKLNAGMGSNIFLGNGQTNWNGIEEKDDEYKSKSSQGNNGLQFRKSKDSKEEVSMVQLNLNENITEYEAPIMKPCDVLLQSDYISQQDQQMEISSPQFPPRIKYTTPTTNNNDFWKVTRIQSDQSSRQRPRIDSDTVKESSGPHESEGKGNSEDDDEEEEDDELQEPQGGQDTPSQSEMSTTSQERRQFLQNGVIFTKCSVDGFNSHDKKVYLSQNEIELIYQDQKDRKKKNISLNNIMHVEYRGYGEGIKRHIKIIDTDKCMRIKVKPCKATSHKEKDLEFFGKDADKVLKFSDYLRRFIENNVKN